MSELSEAINEMRNMRESYDQIGAAAEAYNTGKVQLAENINAKGVQASATETLPDLAEKVNAISQETYEINGGEMYAKQLFGSLETPKYWDLYEVLAQLLSDGRLISYGGILLAEYYKGYDTIALSNAGAGGAYMTSDGDFYTEDIVHTWHDHDDMIGNRWVAYLFANEGHEFVINDTNTSPRSIFVGRNIGVIRSTVSGRVSQITVPDLGNSQVGSLQLGSMQWDKHIIIRNLVQTSGTAIYEPTNTESVFVHTKRFTGGTLLRQGSNVRSFIFVSDEPVSGGALMNGQLTVTDVIISADGSFNLMVFDNGNDQSPVSIKNITLVAESLALNFTTHQGGARPMNIYIKYKTNDKTKGVSLYNDYGDGYNRWRLVNNVVLKDGWCKPLYIAACQALTEANMYAHILQRLKQDEPNCGVGVTITLGSTNLNKLTSEESQDLLALLRGTYGYTFA